MATLTVLESSFMLLLLYVTFLIFEVLLRQVLVSDAAEGVEA